MELWKKIIIASSASAIATLLLAFMGFHSIFNFIVRDQTSLRQRNEVREFYLKLPIPMEFKVYFFNVSNPMEVQNGATPVLQEVGPYVYNLYKEKILVEENESEDSLKYKPSDAYEFSQNKSGTLSQDDYVTILNPLIVGMVNQVVRDSPVYLSLLNRALSSIFKNSKTIYLTIKVRDILFDGFPINCKLEDFPSKAVCTQIKSALPNIKEPTKNVYMFSLFGSKNGTQSVTYKILRGITKSKDLGRVIEFNNEKMLKIWTTDECNRFQGTDGWIFPPFLTKEEGIWSFSHEICRSLHLEFVEDEVVKGIPTRRYHGNLGDQSKNPEDKCYCPTPTTCLRKGVYDLSKCLGVPIYATLPHFLETDPYYLEGVKGLKPNLSEHMIRVDFEYMLGVPIIAKKRLQLNLEVQKVSKIDLMNNVPEVLHPMLWIEEGIELEGPLLHKVSMVITLLKVVEVGKYLCLLLSVAGIGYGIYLKYKNKNLATITPVFSNSKSIKGYLNRAMMRSGENIS